MTCRTATALACAALLAGCGELFGPTLTPVFFVGVTTGGDHTCGVAEDRSAYCWGWGDDGQLGDGQVQSSGVPVRVAGEPVWTSLSAGGSHSCGITVDALAYCWGWNPLGQLGIGSHVGLGGPGLVAGDHRWAILSAGWYHTCGVTTGGEAYCWGFNQHGQLGTGDAQDRSAPAPVAGGLRFATVSAGAFHSCGVTPNGEAYCWGLNHMGQLGDGSSTGTLVPVRVAGDLNLSLVSAGFSHSCGIDDAGRAFCWGSNEYGELGNTVIDHPGVPGSTTPGPVYGRLVFTSIDAGHGVSCGRLDGGRAVCWGRGIYGQLGTGSIVSEATPHYVGGALSSFEAISARGRTHTCGLGRGKSIFCWGTGERGQLGNPTLGFSPEPVRVPGAR